MKSKLVSVAIPAYNHERFIEECLESVCSQTYPNLELIIVDDGSSDETYNIATSFIDRHKHRFHRVEIISQKNKGVSETSNEIVRASCGEWVHLLGSDDRLYPNKIEVIQRFIHEWNCPDLALVHADVDLIDSDSHPIRGGRLRKKRPDPGLDREAWKWLFFNDQYIFNPTVALRREAVLSVGGFNKDIPLEDLDCWLRLSALYPVARVPEILASYRKHAGNSSRQRLVMLAALLQTFGNFLATDGNRFTSADIRRHFRKCLKQVWRRLRKSDPSVVSPVVAEWFRTFNETPGPDNYYNLSGLVKAIVQRNQLVLK